MTEGETVGHHHRFNGREFDGLGGLACYNPWDCKELDMIEQLTHIQTPTKGCYFTLFSYNFRMPEF